jgi:tRNA A37 methylthiotransferase MiaB
VLAARDEVLARIQAGRIGETLEVLVDEAEGEDSERIGRGDMDAPEVDLVARLQGVPAEVGDRVKVRVEGLDEEYNLICGPADPTTAPTGRS